MIESWHVREVLRSRLGSLLVDEPGFAEAAAAPLLAYAPYKSSLSELTSQVEENLFNVLYSRLGPAMSVRMHDGSIRRVHMSEIKEAADDVMGVLFNEMKVYSVQYEALHAYCMESGSFSAMRALITRYGDFLPSSEKQIMARIIRDTRPRADWDGWLPEC